MCGKGHVLLIKEHQGLLMLRCQLIEPVMSHLTAHRLPEPTCVKGGLVSGVIKVCVSMEMWRYLWSKLFPK